MELSISNDWTLLRNTFSLAIRPLQLGYRIVYHLQKLHQYVQFTLPLQIGCLLRGFTSENCRPTCDKKLGSNIFIVDTFCKKLTCN